MRQSAKWGLLVALAVCQGIQAGGVEELAALDFSLRLPAALTKFSSYADVAGVGGASAASRFATGINPASTAWPRSSGPAYSVSPQGSDIRFERGPALRIATLALGLETPHWGSFQPAVAQIKNNGRPVGDFLLFEGDYAQLQWGQRLNDEFAVGANVNYASFATRAGLAGTLLADGYSDTTGLKGGLLWAAAPRLLAGVVLDYSVSHANTDSYDPACACFLKRTEKSHSSVVRVGLSYLYAEQSSVSVDLLSGQYRAQTTAMTSRVLFAGLEHQFLPGVFGRVGVAHDFRGFTSPTLGVGFSPSKNSSIDVAVQHDMFPELRPEFGRSRLFNISASLSF